MQSAPVLQEADTSHGEQLPPQSTADSEPFFTPSEQLDV
jgi:hypothetical protein